MRRPRRLVVAFGTGTGVGKTWAGAQVLARLAAGDRRVAARKPAQSFAPGEGPTDAEVLAAATGERPHDVCPSHRWYGQAMAPPDAARLLGRPPFTVADLDGEMYWPAGVDVGWVETVGGPRSPIASDGDSVDLARTLAPDLAVLVGDAGLGAINAVRLSATAVAGLGCPLVVLLNRFDGSAVHVANRDRLRADRLDVVTDCADVESRVR